MQKSHIILLACVLVAICACLLFIWYRYAEKKSKDKKQAEVCNMPSQVMYAGTLQQELYSMPPIQQQEVYNMPPPPIQQQEDTSNIPPIQQQEEETSNIPPIQQQQQEETYNIPLINVQKTPIAQGIAVIDITPLKQKHKRSSLGKKKRVVEVEEEQEKPKEEPKEEPKDKNEEEENEESVFKFDDTNSKFSLDIDHAD